jgi:hypothetical protein
MSSHQNSSTIRGRASLGLAGGKAAQPRTIVSALSLEKQRAYWTRDREPLKSHDPHQERPCGAPKPGPLSIFAAAILTDFAHSQ